MPSLGMINIKILLLSNSLWHSPPNRPQNILHLHSKMLMIKQINKIPLPGPKTSNKPILILNRLKVKLTLTNLDQMPLLRLAILKHLLTYLFEWLLNLEGCQGG